MERSILCFDIDGTLITDDSLRYLPDSAKVAVRRAKQAGHLTFINTGRVMVNVDDFIRDVGFDGYICGCGTYINYQGNILLHHQLTAKQCVKTAYLLRECGIFGLYEAADANAYDYRVYERYAAIPGICELIAYFESLGKHFETDIESDAFHFDKFSAWFDHHADMKRFRQEIAGEFDYIDRGSDFCEIVPKGYSKATGIRFLMDYFHVPWERTYAFGDSTNDLPMLEFVKHSVVMNGGDSRVKEAAEYVTGSVEQDGLYQAIAHYGLISEDRN